MSVPEITPAEFVARRDGGETLTLLDVREDWELGVASVPNVLHIPMGQVADRLAELDRTIELLQSRAARLHDAQPRADHPLLMCGNRHDRTPCTLGAVADEAGSLHESAGRRHRAAARFRERRQCRSCRAPGGAVSSSRGRRDVSAHIPRESTVGGVVRRRRQRCGSSSSLGAPMTTSITRWRQRAIARCSA